MTRDMLPAITTGLTIIEAIAITGVLSPLIAHEPDTRPDNDNRPFDLTGYTMMGLGGTLLIGIVGTALWLVRVWL